MEMFNRELRDRRSWIASSVALSIPISSVRIEFSLVSRHVLCNDVRNALSTAMHVCTHVGRGGTAVEGMSSPSLLIAWGTCRIAMILALVNVEERQQRDLLSPLRTVLEWHQTEECGAPLLIVVIPHTLRPFDHSLGAPEPGADRFSLPLVAAP